MKKYLTFIVAILITFGVAYAIGYYIGYNVIDVKRPQQVKPQSSKLISTKANLIKEVEALKRSLKKEQKQNKHLLWELEDRNQQIAKLEQRGQTTTPKLKEEVVPATVHERKEYLTNLVHFFNADKGSTKISDIKCESNSCALTANISAGSQTNPEIAKLMKFLDEYKKSGLFEKVGLSSVIKKADHSEVMLSLTL